LLDLKKEKFKNNFLVQLFVENKINIRIPQNKKVNGNEIVKNEDEASKISRFSMSEFFFKEFVYKNILDSLFYAFNSFSKCHFIDSFRNPAGRLYKMENKFTDALKEIIAQKILDSDNKYSRFINEWLKEMKIGQGLEIRMESEGQGIYVYIKNEDIGKSILLVDVGYGVSQILPLLLKIVLIAYAEFEKWGFLKQKVRVKLFVEEPESHLHPALQSKLADMFVDAAKKFNIQFIIETHSEYLIRKLQYLTAKGDIDPEFTQLYYFNNPDKIPHGEEQVKKINIQEDGTLSDDFGTGFFDEADKIAISIWNMNNAKNIVE